MLISSGPGFLSTSFNNTGVLQYITLKRFGNKSFTLSFISNSGYTMTDRIVKIDKLVASKQRKKRQPSFAKLLHPLFTNIGRFDRQNILHLETELVLLLIADISINPLQTKRGSKIRIHAAQVRGSLPQGSPSFYISQE